MSDVQYSVMSWSAFLVAVLASGCAHPTRPAQRAVASQLLCIVERHGTNNGKLADRFEFTESGLTFHLMIYDAKHRETTQRVYDQDQRLVRLLMVTTISGGERTQIFPWRFNPGQWPFNTVKVRERNYVYGDGGQLVQMRQHMTSTAVSVPPTETIFAYTYEESGRRITQVRFRLHPQRPPLIDKYHYKGKKLVEVESNALLPAPPHRVVIKYDARGNESALEFHHSPPWISWIKKYNYDDRDRLVQAGESHFVWSDDNRLVRDGRLAMSYKYDDEGRLVSAASEYGGGFTMKYSSGCASNFTDDAFTPNVNRPLLEHDFALEYWIGADLPSADNFAR